MSQTDEGSRSRPHTGVADVYDASWPGRCYCSRPLCAADCHQLPAPLPPPHKNTQSLGVPRTSPLVGLLQLEACACWRGPCPLEVACTHPAHPHTQPHTEQSQVALRLREGQLLQSCQLLRGQPVKQAAAARAVELVCRASCDC